MKAKITELQRADLVDILATATYGEYALGIDPTEGESESMYDTSAYDTWEDRLADVLLQGGTLDITDIYSEEPREGWTREGNRENILVRWEEYETWIAEEQGKWGHVVYRVNLQNFLDGCNDPEGFKYATELLINEEGDYYTAYNLMQIILFGEVIYG